MEETSPLPAAATLPLVAPAWLRRLAILLIVLGLLVRTVPLVLDPGRPLETCDGRAYWDLAVNLAQGRGLRIDDPVVVSRCDGVTPGSSRHYSPLLPVIEAAFVKVLGASLWALVIPLLLLSAGVVLGVGLATRDLFGPDAGLLTAAATALEWTGTHYGTWLGYAENLVLLALVLTFWAILRSLKDERFIVWAGLFAGLGYVSKASVGWFFLIAGLGGLVWRLAYRGWRVLADPWYLRAIAVFALFVGTWSLRNLWLFWDGSPSGLLSDWQTSPYTANAVYESLAHPGTFAYALAGKLPVLLVGLLWPLAGLLPRLRAVLPSWRQESVSGLLLGAALLFVLGWLFAGAFWILEPDKPLLWHDPIRYVVPAQVPLLWLTFRRNGLAPPTTGWLLLFGVSGLELGLAAANLGP